MAYSLREINDAVRSDPRGFAEECDDAYNKKIEKAAKPAAGAGKSAAKAEKPAKKKTAPAKKASGKKTARKAAPKKTAVKKA